MKSIKNQFQSNISPTLSTYENEKEITKSTIEEEKMKNIHKKIYSLYNSYYKAYKFQSLKNKQKDLEKTNRNKYKT